MRQEGASPPASAIFLFADAELFNNHAVARDILLHQVIQQIAAMADHFQQAAAGVMVLLVHLQVLGQVVDPLGEDGDLDLGRTGVPLMRRIFLDNRGFFFRQHGFHLFEIFSDHPERGSGDSL